MEEYWDNKPIPLIWSNMFRHHFLLCWDPREAAMLRQGTIRVIRSCPRAGECDGASYWISVTILPELGGVLHAEDVSSAHVDLYIWGGTDHGVEVGLDCDGRAGEGGIAGDFANEHTDLDGRHEPAEPRSLFQGLRKAGRSVFITPRRGKRGA